MKLVMVGLGKMGGNMAERLRRGGVEVVGFDAFAPDRSDVTSLAAAVAELGEGPGRVVWVMVPAGDATQQVVDELAGLLGAGDLVIDGGNSRFSQSIERGAALRGLAPGRIAIGGASVRSAGVAAGRAATGAAGSAGQHDQRPRVCSDGGSAGFAPRTIPRHIARGVRRRRRHGSTAFAQSNALVSHSGGDRVRIRARRGGHAPHAFLGSREARPERRCGALQLDVQSRRAGGHAARR